MAQPTPPDTDPDERRYRLLEPLQEGVLLLDPGWRVLYLNPAAARALDAEPGALRGAVLWDALPSLRETGWETALRDAARTRQARRFVAEDGLAVRVEPCETELCLYLDAGSHRDILLAVVDKLDEAFVLLDREGRYRYVNQQAARMAGRTPAELIGRNAWELYPQARDSPIYEAARQGFETGAPVHLETLAPTLERWLGLSFYPQGEQVAIVSHDITERVEARRALQYRSAQFESLLNQAPLAVYLIDADFRLLEANPIVRAALGPLLGELIGRDFSLIARTLWEEEFADRIVAIFRRTLQTGEPHAVAEEEAFSRLNQRIGYFEWRLHRITLPDGRYGLVCYARDVTAQVQDRRAIEESERRFRTLGEALPLHLWMSDAEGAPLYQNPAWHEYTGLGPEQMAQVGWEALHHPDDLPALQRRWEQALRDRTEFELETRLQQHDGEFRWFTCRVVPVWDSQGRLARWVGSHLDIEERKRSEQALARERERLAVALRAGKLGVYEWRVGDGAVWWSPEIYAVYGVDPASFTPDVNSFNALVHPEDRPELWRKTQESLARGEVFTHEYRIIWPDGSVHWVANRSHVGLDADGKPERLTGVAVDITARRQAEQEIGDLNIRLQRAMAETHHRIKNNLQTLAALMEMVLDSRESMVPVEAVRRLSRHTHTLASLHDLLTQDARAGASQDRVRLRAALDKLIPLLEPIAAGREIRVRAEEIEIPVRQAGSFVLLVNELVTNALKHGRGAVDVAVSRDPDTVSAIRLEVCDQGPGFAPGFDPQAATGMGWELIQSLSGWDLGGNIAFTNPDGGGASVVVTFPHVAP